MKQLNIGVSKQFRPGFSLNANYTIGSAKSDADFGAFPMNQYDLTGEYGRTGWDSRHRFFLIGSAFIPKLKLSLNPMVMANTGRPFNIITGFDDNRDGIINDRPAFADANTPAFDLVRTQWGDFDLRPKPGQTIVPRNYGEGPGFFTVNLRVGRAFSFGDLPGAAERRATAKAQEEQQRQQRGNNRGGDRASNNRGGNTGGGAPRGGGPQVTPGVGGGMMIMMGGPPAAEGKRYTMNFSLNFINLLNRTNYGQPVGNLRSVNFGESLFPASSFGFGGGNPNAGNRRIQASVRFSF
jgi:hypothetical protein